ncbi:hypothetical protein, partial [Spectribacter hydrogenoxidans]
ADQAVDLLSQLSVTTPEPETNNGSAVADAPVAKKVKPTQRIFAASLGKGYIEDESAAENYLDKLRQEINSALAAGKRVDIR